MAAPAKVAPLMNFLNMLFSSRIVVGLSLMPALGSRF
jgi:hypothetical protein